MGRRDYRWFGYSLASCSSAELASASPNKRIYITKQSQENFFGKKLKSFVRRIVFRDDSLIFDEVRRVHSASEHIRPSP